MGYAYTHGNMYGRGDYYQGDYYQGDYYQGDPGFFSGFGHFLTGAAKALIPAPIKAVIGGVSSVLHQQNPLPGTALAPMSAGGLRLPMVPGAVPFPVPPPGQVFVGGGQAGIPVRPQIGFIPRGRHLNKSEYVTRGGGTSKWPRQLLVHPAHTETVPNRHTNYGNARALRRALRRARGFARLARSAGYIMHHYRKPTKKRGFGRRK